MKRGTDMELSSDSVSAAPSVWEPNTVEAAWELRNTLGSGSQYVSGGTLLRTQWESGVLSIPVHLISVASIHEMTGIQIKGETIAVGAATTLNECRKAPVLLKEFPHFIEAIRSIAAPSIRNMATLGGNVISAVGDLIPALLVIGAQLCWFDGISRVTESLESWLYTKSTQESSIEERILISIQLPLASSCALDSGNQRLGKCLTFYHKVGRREAFTPSLITTTYQGRVDADGILCDFRIAAGGGTGFAMRLTQCEVLLNGNPYSVALLQKLQQEVRDQFTTYSDAFASEQYRKNTAANLISSGLWKALEASI
jgi:xanthine dehydrogenase C subunit